mmetsp:Transcript_11441/g.20696  ORF Transcript_11441/g.20696 Transcript_11441/m.20696 type:complete len:403 (-) Transcript_11441:83-1291(-)
MYSFLQRNKRKLAGAAALVSAGGAAYYVYSRWLDYLQDGDDRHVADIMLRPSFPPRSSMLAHENARGSDGAGKGDARKAGISELGEGEVEQDSNVEERLAAYFESVQEIAGKTALPEFLPSLSAALASATALDELVLNLRTQQLTREEKLSMWDKLKVESFVFVLGAVWATATLEAFLRLQLSVLGRLLYIQSATSGQQRAPFGAVMPAECQRDYLRHAQVVTTAGLVPLLEKLRHCLRPLLGQMVLTTPCTVEELLAVLSDAQQSFAATTAEALWCDVLFPPNEAVTRSEERGSPEECAVVSDMFAESRSLIATSEFDGAVKACAASTSRSLASVLRESVTAAEAGATAGPEGLPLAKLIPIISNAGRKLLEAQLRLSSDMANLPAVHRMCAAAYSSGPPL